MTERSEFILDPGRHFREESAFHEAVFLEMLERARQHLFRDVADNSVSLSFTEHGQPLPDILERGGPEGLVDAA